MEYFSFFSCTPLPNEKAGERPSKRGGGPPHNRNIQRSPSRSETDSSARSENAPGRFDGRSTNLTCRSAPFDPGSDVRRLQLSSRDAEGTHNMTDKESVDTRSSSNNFSVFFQNINGFNRKKGAFLNVLSKRCTVVTASETNLTENMTSLFLRAIAKNDNFATICARNDRVILNGESVPGNKTSGFGTALVSKNKNTKLIFSSENFEILAVSVVYDKLKILVISVYRSPSLKKEKDLENFFNEISDILFQHSNEHDVIIYGGDDNIDPLKNDSFSKKCIKYQESTLHKYKLFSVLGDNPTRKKYQPDSCYIKYNPNKVEFSVDIIQDLIGSDHNPIKIEIIPHDFKLVSKKMKSIWKWTKKPEFKNGKDGMVTKCEHEAVASKFNNFCENFYEKSKNDIFSDKEVENTCQEFMKCLNLAKKAVYYRKKLKVPVVCNPRMTSKEIKYHALIRKKSMAVASDKSNPSDDKKIKIN